jgi:hypothetical protein
MQIRKWPAVRKQQIAMPAWLGRSRNDWHHDCGKANIVPAS